MPPHLRNQPPSSSPSPAERTPNDGYTLEELAHQFDCKHKAGTLNSNAEKGIDWDHSSLAFIVIFKAQHPHRPPKIFCKTNLNLLPASASAGAGDTANAKENGVHDNDAQDPSAEVSIPLSAPIPIFTQLTPHRFIFTDRHAITHISYLAPESKELGEMLDTKFSPQNKKRLAESWKASLNLGWAVVGLERGEGEEGNPMGPVREVERMGVAERLAEMRGWDEGGGWGSGGGRLGGRRGGRGGVERVLEGGVWMVECVLESVRRKYLHTPSMDINPRAQ